MKCKNCGFNSSKQARFCMECGQELKKRKLKLWQVGLCICVVALIACVVFISDDKELIQIDNKFSNKSSDVSESIKARAVYDNCKIIIDEYAAGTFAIGILGDDGNLRFYDCGSQEFETKMTDVTSFRYGYGCQCYGAITKNGDLHTWGKYNTYGNLGNGTTEDSHKPLKILENIKFISTIDSTGAAINKDNELYLWGYYGNLEECDQTVRHGNYSSPALLKPRKILDNIVYASIGGMDNYNAAIATNGDLYVWGDKVALNGEYFSDQWEPTKVMENIVSVDVGSHCIAAVTNENVLYTWGDNFYGRLGNGDDSYSSCAPTEIMDNVAYCNLGEYVGYAITINSELYLWGCDENGIIIDSLTPRKVMDDVRFCTLSPDESRVAILTNDNSLYMWGSNEHGAIGNGTTYDAEKPIKVLENIDSVALSDFISVAITAEEELYVWGYDLDTELLDDGTTFDIDALSPILV